MEGNRLSNTLINDDSSGTIAYAEQIFNDANLEHYPSNKTKFQSEINKFLIEGKKMADDKIVALENSIDAAVEKVDRIDEQLNTGGVDTNIIDTFNEIKNFLDEYDNTSNLMSIISGINTKINTLNNSTTSYNVNVSCTPNIFNIEHSSTVPIVSINASITKKTFSDSTGTTVPPNPNGTIMTIDGNAVGYATLPVSKNVITTKTPIPIKYSPVYTNNLGESVTANKTVYYYKMPPILGAYCKRINNDLAKYTAFTFDEGTSTSVTSPVTTGKAYPKVTGSETITITIPKRNAAVTSNLPQFMKVYIAIPKGFEISEVKPFYQPDALDQEIVFTKSSQERKHTVSYGGQTFDISYYYYISTLDIDRFNDKRISIKITSKKFTDF